jgi:cytochrome P450
MGIGYSTVSAMSNETHRVRRGRLNPFFSRKMVLELEGIVHTKAEKLCALVADKFKKNEEVDIHHGFRAVSVDIISDYAFGECYDLLDRPDLGMEFFFMVQGLGPMMWTFMQWPGLQKFMMSLPPAVSKATSPPMKQLLGLQEVSPLFQYAIWNEFWLIVK